MEEMIFNSLKSYGVIGVILAYFLWKDCKAFTMYKSTIEMHQQTMKELVTVLQEMKSKQTEMSCDLDVLKEKIDHLN